MKATATVRIQVHTNARMRVRIAHTHALNCRGEDCDIEGIVTLEGFKRASKWRKPSKWPSAVMPAESPHRHPSRQNRTYLMEEARLKATSSAGCGCHISSILASSY